MPEQMYYAMMPLNEYAKHVREEVLSRCAGEAPQDEQERAFTEWCLEELADHNETDGAEALDRPYQAESRGRWPAAKLNAWALSGDGATLDLFISLYHGEDDIPTVSLPDTRRHFKLLIGFLRRALEGFHTQIAGDHDDAHEIALAIYDAKGSLTTVRLFFLTDGVAPRAEDIEQEKLDGLELRYVLWDLKKLSQIRVGHRELIQLDFENEYGYALPCLAGPDNEEYQTFIAFMPGKMLARIYGEYGQRLLERNVRAFLQTKGKVNKGIQQTLRESPHRFLAYNNGLCCTAAEVRMARRKDGQMELAWVSDFQIVNGGQTTASIYHAHKKERLDIEKVVVQIKLTVMKAPERIDEMVPLIARYANSQNKVNAADLAANGPFQQKLEQLSRLIWAPPNSSMGYHKHWYYERSRGAYLDEKMRQGTPAKRREWERLNPRECKFTKTDLAKYEHAWLGLPHYVCLGAEKNFVKFAVRMEEEGEPEVTREYFEHVVAKAILWRTAEKLFDSLDLGGYRANTVAYAIAWLAEKSGRRIDLNRIWSEQKVPTALRNALETVCKEAWEHLNRQQGNIGEASKKAECWEAFRSKDIALASDWQAELAKVPFITPCSEAEALAVKWEQLRHNFIADMRTMEQLEAHTGQAWVRTRRRDVVARYAALNWELLRASRLGLKKIRGLIEMLDIASRG